MVRLMTFLESESCRTLVLALLHTLWQGFIAAGLLYLYLRKCPAGAASKRYAASIAALAAIVVAGLLTWSILNYAPMHPAQNAIGSASIAAGRSSEDARPYDRPFVVTPHVAPPPSAVVPAEGGWATSNALTGTLRTGPQWQVWAMGAWLAGVMLMLGRTGIMLIGENRLRRRCELLIDERILSLVDHLRERMRIGRRIAVYVSERVCVPGVVGCIWPALLLPVSAVSGVPIEDLQAILTHELAHIKRYDYLVNFCQMVIEALLFFNPAVWWISRQIRIEREACCDAAGVALAGQGVKYAEALVAWAQRLSQGPATATISFAGQPDPGNLLDRIKRITIAGHRPQLRISWPTLMLMIALSILCLAGLWKGTDLAVTAAARILTPQERIDKIAEVSKEYGGHEYGPNDQIRISGVARTWDGKPPTGEVHVAIGSARPGQYTFGSRVTQTVGDEIRFDQSASYGRIFIILSADGYAPAFGGPFEAEPGGHIDGVELTLGAGFPARIQVVDQDGLPIKGAELTGGYPYREIQSFLYTINLTTDANGVATLEHAAAEKVTLFVHANGFESRKVEGLVPDVNVIRVVTLKKGQPAGGTVTAKATGLPIKGAEVHVLESTTANSQLSVGSVSGPPDATTNDDGRFELKRLLAGWKYLIFVRAPGYGYEYVPDVTTADQDLRIALGEKQVIKGKIIGDLSLLSAGNSIPFISVVDRYQFSRFSGWTGYPTTKVVTIHDGVGYFEIDDFWGQTVTLSAGGRSVRLKIGEDSLDNVVIDLSPASKREVILRFQVPPGVPPVEGSVHIDYFAERSSQQKRSQSMWLNIKDGQTRCEIPVPARFRYGVDQEQRKRIIGYWFKQASSSINIERGDDPFVIDVRAYPAGVLYGRVYNFNGSLSKNARVGPIAIQLPPIEGQKSLNSGDMSTEPVDQGTFRATPLPLGGQYAIVAYEDYSFAMSEAFSLDEKNPIVQTDLHLPQGVDVEGRLLDADGTPVRSSVSLDVSVKRGEHSWGLGGEDIRTDENGRFVFRNVNPGPGGTCSVRVNSRVDYQPVAQQIEDLRAPLVVRLQKGFRATGTVIDDVTGLPVPGVEVYAYGVISHDNQTSSDWELLDAEGRTNDQSQFVFSNMAQRQYRLGVRNANLANLRESVIVTGGQSDPVVLRIRILEGSDLKPRKP